MGWCEALVLQIFGYHYLPLSACRRLICAILCLFAASSSTAAKREVDAYLAERNKYKQRSEQQAKKGSEREAETLKMLAAFQSKVARSRRLAEYVSAGVADDVDEEEEETARNEDDVVDDDTNDLSWLVRGLLLRPSRGVEYCDLSVCVCLCASISLEPLVRSSPNFFACPCGHGSFLIWRRCNMLCTSSSVDDVMFGRNGPNGPTGEPVSTSAQIYAEVASASPTRI